MKQATLPLYIRIGDIPKNKQSKVHRSDQIIRNEGGVSVWKAVEVNGLYYPILPKHPNRNAIADYFDHLLHSKDPVYLVTGTEIFIEGADREPLLIDIKIIKDITHYYRVTDKMIHSIRESLVDKIQMAGFIDTETSSKIKEELI